jgi:hypothetical protein
MSFSGPDSPEQLLKSYFRQLTTGCLFGDCTHSFCAASPTFTLRFTDPNHAAVQAIHFTLAHPANPNLCPNIHFEDPWEIRDRGAISNFNSAIGEVSRGSVSNAKRASGAIALVFSLPETFAFVLMPVERVLHPKIQWFGFDDDFVNALPASLAAHSSTVNLTNFSRSFADLVTSVVGDAASSSMHHIRALILIHILFPLTVVPRYAEANLVLLARHILTLSPWASSTLSTALSRYAPVLAGMAASVVRVIGGCAAPYAEGAFERLRPLLGFVGFLHRANVCGSKPAADRCFQCPGLEAHLKTSAELQRVHAGRPTYLDYACVVSFAFKRKALKALIRHHRPPIAELCVARDRLAVDILAEMAKIRGACLTRVEFRGEPGIDAGGVRREFFQLGARQLFSPDYAMFALVMGAFYWFTENSFESMDTYEAIGRFVGLAVLNHIPLPVRLPRLLYKKLLGIPLNITDIAELDDEQARSLEQIRQYRDDGNDVADLSLTFAVAQEQFGQTVEIPFFDGGENVDVTNERLDEFLGLKTAFVLEGSVCAQLEAFKRGFKVCCGHKLFEKFTPYELDLLVSGETEYNWKDLRAGSQLRGYDPNSNVVKWFWEVFDALNEEQKKRVLLFACGNDAVPIGGLRVLAFRIDKDPNPEHLPTSHTCFNTIVIPEYPSKRTLHQKLLVSLANVTGFGEK